MMAATPSLFGEKRVQIFAWLFLAISALRAVDLITRSEGLLDRLGKPLGYDFITFWSAGWLALEGRPEAAFVQQEIFQAQRLAVPGSDAVFLWHYPPTFMLLAAGLGLIPYIWSYGFFIAASLGGYLVALRRLCAQPGALLLALAYPAVFLTMLHGQNSLLSTALLAGAILLCDRRPLLAGVCIGLLAFKPQFGLLLPLVLLASGQWRVFLSAAVTSLTFAGLSLLIFGVDLWIAFFENASRVSAVMEQGMLNWGKMPSLFITLRLFDVPQSAAYGAHVAMAVAVVASLLWLWWRRGATRLAWAALVPAMLLILPYVFDYELALLAIPLAILADDMARRGAHWLEKSLLVVTYVTPMALAGIGQNFTVQIGFYVILALYAVALRRAFLAEAAEPLREP